MFPHLFFGSLIFLLLGNFFNLPINKTFLFVGGIIGLVPDLFSLFKIKNNKWCHEHRDNLSHSIFFPFIVFIASCFLGIKIAIIIGVAVLSHSFVDLFGIGWGVKLFYPLSKITYKLFYNGKFIVKFTEEKLEVEVKKNGIDNWIKKIYFTLNPVGIYEWISLILFLAIILLI